MTVYGPACAGTTGLVVAVHREVRQLQQGFFVDAVRQVGNRFGARLAAITACSRV
jgi:nucleoside-triphosphatase THEP1